MKQNLLLFLFIFPLFLTAQVTLDLVVPDTSVVVDPAEVDVVGKGTLTNTSEDSVTVTWSRNILDITDGWETAVCDKNLCYNPPIDQMSLELAPGETSNFDIHIYPFNIAGSAIIEMTITDDNNPDNTVSGQYRFNQTSTSTRLVPTTDIKVFPNPTVDFISLSDPSQVASILVYNIIGQPVKQFTVNGSNRFNVIGLPTGIYLVRLLNRRNQTIKTIRLSKRGGA